VCDSVGLGDCDSVGVWDSVGLGDLVSVGECDLVAVFAGVGFGIGQSGCCRWEMSRVAVVIPLFTLLDDDICPTTNDEAEKTQFVRTHPLAVSPPSSFNAVPPALKMQLSTKQA
jgi:hypothetical protein